MFKKVLVVALMAVAMFIGADSAYADGNGSSAACLGKAGNVMSSQGGDDNGGSQDLATVNVGAGNVVTGVCIKSGSKMFNGNQHSEVLGNGTYEDGCYTISGVGTQVAKVTRNQGGNSCQGISHIDVVYETSQSQIDYCDKSTFSGSVGEVVPLDVRCVEISVSKRCGVLEGFISNLTPYNYGISWSEGAANYNTNTNLPASFPEDYNNGSVIVFYWVVGAEADYVTGRNIPNFWEKNAASITVGTDCEKESAPADISASIQCVTVAGQAKIELTLKNNGESNGVVTVNGEEVEVAAGKTVVEHFAPKTNVTVLFNNQAILNETLECEPGRGGEGGETTGGDGDDKVVSKPVGRIAELPLTSGSSTPVIAAGASALAVIILAVGSAVKARLLAA